MQIRLLISVYFVFLNFLSIYGQTGQDVKQDVKIEGAGNGADEFKKLLMLCPDFQKGTYTIYPFIEAASYLQKAGKKQAVDLLKQLAERQEYENQIIVLCRMLFKEKVNGGFRRPVIGIVAFIGRTGYIDWRREPIEIVNNSPFLIVAGYNLAGFPEPAIDYIKYCENTCDWIQDEYKSSSKEEARKDLDELLKSDKWKVGLKDYEKDFFYAQIKTRSLLKKEYNLDHKDTLISGNLKIDKHKAFEIANEVADKELKKFNKTKEAIKLGASFELANYKTEIKQSVLNEEEYWFVYYWYDVSKLSPGKILFYGHPVHFCVRVNSKTGKYDLLHGE